MARGRVREAVALYRRGSTIAREHLLFDPQRITYAKVLTRELELERNRAWNGDEISLAQASNGYISADFGVELARETRGIDYALEVVDEMWAAAHRAGMTRLERHFAGLWAAVLAGAGRVGDAEAHWREQALPRCSTAVSIWPDRAGGRWRCFPAQGCACAPPEVSSKRVGGSRSICSVSQGNAACGEPKCEPSPKGWRTSTRRASRTRPRSTWPHFSGSSPRTDYARPMVRERAAAVPVLTRFLDANPGSPLAKSAVALLMAARTGAADTVPTLTGRELEELRRLETQPDRGGPWSDSCWRAIPRAAPVRQARSTWSQVAVERARSLGILRRTG